MFIINYTRKDSKIKKFKGLKFKDSRVKIKMLNFFEHLKFEHLNFQTLRLLFIAFSLFTSNLLFAQDKTSLKLLVRPLPDSILLRWAPTNFEGWNAGNKYGYTIMRFTLVRNGEMINHPDPEIITTVPIKPWPLKEWDKIIDNDDFAAVAAQAIYGETFELSATQKTSVFDVINKVKEQDSRFSFALYGADQSPLAAKASGLWYTDKNVKKGEKYLYRVFLTAPKEVVIADTAFAFTGIDEYLPLPKPLDLKADFGDKGVILHWDRKLLNYLFNSYSVERSEDGATFRQINKQPIVYAQSEDFKESDELLFIDSLANNDKKYFYRVIGHTAFGEKSPSSTIVSGTGEDEVKAIPEISEDFEQDGAVVIRWNFPKQEESAIAGFKLVRARNFKMKYDTISLLLNPSTRECEDKKPLPTNYYKILVFTKNGKHKASVPSLFQMIDSIPPASPIGLKAVADTTGKLTLSWKANTEEDIYGYRIYRANAANEEFSQMTVEPLRDTVFIDHINLRTLTKKIYYQIMAIDKRQNHSTFSLPLEVERPDIVPPAPPALVSIKSLTTGVWLEWKNSTSEDVAKHLILRKENGSNDFKIVKEIPATDSSLTYIDSTAITSTIYHYVIVAQDKSGLKSSPSIEMAGQKMPSPKLGGLGDVKYKTDRKNFKIILSWNAPIGETERYVIYRKAGETGVMAVYTSISGNDPSFIDARVKSDTQYTYRVQAVMKGGDRMMSREVKIDF
jgi:fibronectin type 3 domain-containing protein